MKLLLSIPVPVSLTIIAAPVSVVVAIQRQPFSDLEALDDRLEDGVCWELRGADLEQEEVRVNHGLAKVALNVCHCLAFDLKAIADPKPAHDLVESCLKLKIIKFANYFGSSMQVLLVNPLCACSALHLLRGMHASFTC